MSKTSIVISDDDCPTTVELSSVDNDSDMESSDDGSVAARRMWCDWRQFKEFLMNEYMYGKILSYTYFPKEKKCWRITFI